ncbi:MAG: tryptophan 7-halogenase [Asticcacaulis sp.]
MTTGPLRAVTIVGGGTAGWMTAAMLSHLFAGQYHIRLVESDEIGIIGVGEATIPAIRLFNQLLGIDDVEMLKATRGTFKLGIEFVDWREKGHSYIHGFGKIGVDRLWLRPHQFWLKMFPKGGFKDFDHYAINVMAARAMRFSDGRGPKPVSDIDFAYHFDASLYGQFLRRRAEARGVERIEGRIVEVRQNTETGFVDSVRLSDGRDVGGDLFIDCSGQRGLLIAQTLGVGFEDWSQWLPCDRALAVPCEGSTNLTPYTRSTAREAGWQWRIPLQHRIGNGHVYSSRFTDDETAADRLMSTLDGKALADPKPIRFIPGKRLKTFEKNVVALGLASGFLEPLESTSIHLIQTAILRLVSLFPAADFDPVSIREFNRQTDAEYTDIRDFIIAHYKVTRREDTPFWAYCKHMDVPDSLQSRLDLFQSSARFFKRNEIELFREESWIQVLIGQGMAARYDPSVDLVPEAEAAAYLRDIEEVIAGAVSRLPTHDEVINRHFRA